MATTYRPYAAKSSRNDSWRVRPKASPWSAERIASGTHATRIATSARRPACSPRGAKGSQDAAHANGPSSNGSSSARRSELPADCVGTVGRSFRFGAYTFCISIFARSQAEARTDRIILAEVHARGPIGDLLFIQD